MYPLRDIFLWYAIYKKQISKHVTQAPHYGRAFVQIISSIIRIKKPARNIEMGEGVHHAIGMLPAEIGLPVQDPAAAIVFGILSGTYRAGTEENQPHARQIGHLPVSFD